MNMKKLFLLLVIISSLFTLRAQDTIYPFAPGQIFESDSINSYENNPPGFNYLSVLTQIRFCPAVVSDRMVTGLAISGDYSEILNHLYPGEPVKIWGVIATLDSNDYRHPTFHFTQPLTLNQDETHYSYAYRYTHLPSDCYIGIHYTAECPDKVEIDTVFGATILYFDNPLILNDTFWMSEIVTDAQDYSNLLTMDIRTIDQCFNGFNAIHHNLPFIFYRFDSIVQHNLTIDLHNLTSAMRGSTYGYSRALICPVFTLPDTDSFGCPEVEEFAFAGMNAGSPTFVWDTASEHEVHQVAYGPYDAPLESLRIAETNARFLELFDNSLRPDIYYQARVRARCHHRCPIHDTVMWTAWSAPVYFYTGDHMPDTTHQPEGIDAPGEVLPFAIVPNPSRTGARQVVEIGRQVPLQGLTLTLHDAAGHEVLRMEVKEHRFALPASLPAGVYVATLASPQGTAVRRVVVES